MSKRTILGLSLTLALAGTVTSTALARRPPALARAQENAAQVLSTCPESSAPSNYRGMQARAASRAAPSAVTAVVKAPVLHAMGDHVVLLCEGGRVHGPSGYRDLDRRFRAQSPEVEVAKASAACM